MHIRIELHQMKTRCENTSHSSFNWKFTLTLKLSLILGEEFYSYYAHPPTRRPIWLKPAMNKWQQQHGRKLLKTNNLPFIHSLLSTKSHMISKVCSNKATWALWEQKRLWRTQRARYDFCDYCRFLAYSEGKRRKMDQLTLQLVLWTFHTVGSGVAKRD